MDHDFRHYLKAHLVLFDGAMGTYAYQKGIFIDKCFDALNLTNPELIRSIHEDYREAGADVIETNTFGANRFKLKKHNLEDQVREINLKGVQIARSAGEGFVAGSIGPLGVKIAPWGDVSLEAAREAFRQQAEVLDAGGVDLFVLETFQNLEVLEQAVLAVKSVSDKPVIAQMAFREDGRSAFGSDINDMADKLNALDVDVIGLNCVLGPKQMLDNLEQLVLRTNKPISILPNAGHPQYLDGRTFYMSTPDYFGVYAMRFISAGVRIMGGCCGTTPDHIRKMAEAVAQKQTRLKRVFDKPGVSGHNLELPEPVALRDKSDLSRKLACGEYIRLVEMVSPRGRDASREIEGARKLKDFGIDAVNIPDGPRASARMNAQALGIVLQSEVGIETVLHYTCRDRNLLGIQSDLLGAAALGIRNILAITGDPPKMGDYPNATAVFDIDAIGLTRFISNLNHGLDLGDKPIGRPTAFLVGVGVDPNSINPKLEQERFRKKVEAGAEYAITQPVFDVSALKSFLESMSDVHIPIIAGVWPLVSLRNAEFMKNEVPGVIVPDPLIERIGKFDTREDQMKAGIEIAREMAQQVRSFTQGIQISAPFGRVQIALDVIA